MNGCDLGKLKEKSNKSNRRISENFHLPTLLNDPLLNFLAYGSILGYIVQGIGLVPYDLINIDLKEIRKKRSISDWFVAYQSLQSVPLYFEYFKAEKSNLIF